MKFFLAFLTVALAAEVSWAASIHRPTRDADEKKTSYQIARDLVAFMMPTYATIAKELPDTPAFSTYKANINEIQNYYLTKNDDIFCYQKTINLMTHLKEHNDKLKEDKSEEAKKILELFEKHKDETVVNNFLDEMEDADDPTIEEVLETC